MEKIKRMCVALSLALVLGIVGVGQFTSCADGKSAEQTDAGVEQTAAGAENMPDLNFWDYFWDAYHYE